MYIDYEKYYLIVEGVEGGDIKLHLSKIFICAFPYVITLFNTRFRNYANFIQYSTTQAPVKSKYYIYKYIFFSRFKN